MKTVRETWNPQEILELLTGVIDYRGRTPPKSSSGIPCISAANVKNGVVSIGDKFISKELYAKWTTRGFIKPGDVLITTEAPVGEVAQVPSDQTYLITRRVMALQVDPEVADEKFLKYILLDDDNKKKLTNLAHGATVPRIYKEDVLEYELLMPPLPTQRKIAAILTAYDDLIENNTRRIQILEEMAQAIYREWFVHFHFPGHEDVRMVDSGTELGEVPEGWEVKKLGDLAESVRRNIKPGELEQMTPYFGLEHLPRKSIALNQWDFVDDVGSTKLAFLKGEILFGKIRPYFHKVGVAPLDGIGSSDIIVIRPKNSDYFGLILAVVSSKRFVEHSTLTSQGTKMPRANWDVLVEYPIARPVGNILERYNSFMQEVVDLIHVYIFSNSTLRETRNLLLPKLVSGELDVSELEIV